MEMQVIIKEGLDYVMLYIKPELFLEGLRKKDIIKFSNSAIYDEKIKCDILKLGNAILNQKDEALCSELNKWQKSLISQNFSLLKCLNLI
jgi:hypothetical protein